MPRARAFDPFSGRGRRSVAAILCTFALSSALSVGLSIWSTSGSRHQAAVVQVAARQRTLAERYIEEVLIARQGDSADPAAIAQKLRRSADALLDGGVAPAIDGDDDATRLSRARGSVVRRQLEQARRLVADLTATGSALLRGEPVTAVWPTASMLLGFASVGTWRRTRPVASSTATRRDSRSAVTSATSVPLRLCPNARGASASEADAITNARRSTPPLRPAAPGRSTVQALL